MISHQSCIEDEEDRSRIRAALSESATRKDVEQSFNQFVILDAFFSAGPSTTTDEENLYLAERIAEMWGARLALLFPYAKCVVELRIVGRDKGGALYSRVSELVL